MRPLLVLLLLLPVAAAPRAADAASATVTARAGLETTSRDGLRMVQSGRVRTTPFGPGRMTLRSEIRAGRLTATFTVRLGSSTVRGRASGRILVADGRVTSTGTAAIVGGTGRFRRARADGLSFSSDAPLDGRSIDVAMRGRVRY